MEEIKIFELKDVYDENEKAVVVKLPRPIELIGATGEKELIEPIYIYGEEDNSSTVRILYTDDFNSADFAHYNVVEDKSTEYGMSTYELTNNMDSFKKGDIVKCDRYRYFCNPILQRELYDNPEVVANLVAMQLEQPNPNNAYSESSRAVESYVYPSRRDKIVKCDRCGEPIRATGDNTLCLLTKMCPSCYKHQMEVFPEQTYRILSELNNTGYYAKLLKQGVYKHLKRYPKKPENYSTYYPIIDASSLGDLESLIPTTEIDLLLLGCGSAGSNIVEQLARTNMLKSYMLVDFDKVEKKNLRNQCYRHSETGYTKAYALESYIRATNTNNANIDYRESKFQDVNYRFKKFKYTVLAFDSIDTRLEALKYIQDGIINTEYIIDTRYKDLNCSIYFVNTKDEKQMSYYEQCLLEDKKQLDTINHNNYIMLSQQDDITPFVTKDRIKQIWSDKNYFSIGCGQKLRSLGLEAYSCYGAHGCGTDSCVDCLYQNLKDIPYERIASGYDFEKLPLTQKDVRDILDLNSCYHYNIIDIYKYSSCFITSAIREIFSNKPKPFTHVETDTNAIPKSMVVME